MNKPKTYPEIETPSLGDIIAAENHLFEKMPTFGESGWRLWTDAERRQINELAVEIMNRRLGRTKH